jgi:hypothetical protein
LPLASTLVSAKAMGAITDPAGVTVGPLPAQLAP